ncbi:MAG TPA: DNA polymerase III subunit delta [Candidatus Saccharimonadales bacterium]|nr:DNA polymerase III subunit delta [Candidatus Saccharimonadales bacterium]
MLITLTGENDYRRNNELQKLIADFIEKYTDMAVEHIDGEDSSYERLQESMQSLPFLTARKLVILKEPAKQKAFIEHVGDLLRGVPETTDVVIVEPKLDKRLTYYKVLNKQTDFRTYSELDAKGLAVWAIAYAKEQGGSLNAQDARLLIDRLGTNQQLLQHELDKLVTYDSNITGGSIRQLTEPMPQSTIFELIDSAFSGNMQHTLQLYREQRALKVEPQAIIAMLAWQLHVLALVKVSGPKSADEVARTAKLNPYVVRKSQALVHSLPLQHLKTMIGQLLQLDLRLKSTSIDADEVLQNYLLALVAKA